MTREEYLTEAMEQISDRYIAEAALIRRAPAGSSPRYRRVTAVLAACACIVLVIGLAAGSLGLWGAGEGGSGGSGITVSEDGVTIPPLSVDGEQGAANMVLFVIYQGGIYSQYEELPAELKGEYLDTSAGGIDEWTPQSEYGELTGSAAGKLYAVQGYDTGFMVGLEMENGSLMGLIRNNGITLKEGRELFEDRLRLNGRFTQVTWQSREDWYNGTGGEQVFTEVHQEALERFVTALCEAEFMRSEDIPLPDGADNIYDSLEVCHLFFRLEDGLTVHLRCFAGGYVSFAGIRGVCVQIPEDIFAAVCEAF